MEPMTFDFDATTAEELKRDGMQRAEDHAEDYWKSAAQSAIRAAACELDLITASDVWDRISPDFATHENRALGALMRKAAQDGWIEATPDWKTTGRAVSHNRPMRVWRSKLR